MNSTVTNRATLGGIGKFLCIAFFAAVFAKSLSAEPAVTKTTWRDFDAFRLTDGRTEAIIVPELGGRLMHYGLVGRENWIWNGQSGAERRDDALMWGGDKTYIGPHTMWNFTQPKAWPPPFPDTAPHRIVDGTRALLATISAEWPGYGSQVTREYTFEKGDFVTRHSVRAITGHHALGAVWVITQTVPTEFVFVPLDPKSPYKDNFFWFGFGSPKDQVGAKLRSASLLEIRPITGTGFKLGASPKRPALAAVKDGRAFVQSADRQEGQYPEGADGAGFSVEVYHHHLPGAGEYTELEMLSPLRRLDRGATLTTRWNIHDFSSERGAIERLLGLDGESGQRRD